MNREIVERIYHEAAALCVKEGKSIAWIFEDKFAELIVKKCADIAAVNTDRENVMTKLKESIGIDRTSDSIWYGATSSTANYINP